MLLPAESRDCVGFPTAIAFRGGNSPSESSWERGLISASQREQEEEPPVLRTKFRFVSPFPLILHGRMAGCGNSSTGDIPREDCDFRLIPIAMSLDWVHRGTAGEAADSLSVAAFPAGDATATRAARASASLPSLAAWSAGAFRSSSLSLDAPVGCLHQDRALAAMLDGVGNVGQPLCMEGLWSGSRGLGIGQWRRSSLGAAKTRRV